MPGACRVVYDSPSDFDPGTVYSVRVEARDLSVPPNRLEERNAWSFTTQTPGGVGTASAPDPDRLGDSADYRSYRTLRGEDDVAIPEP